MDQAVKPAQDRAAVEVPFRYAVPIPMVLHCPECSGQHIDAPDPGAGWDNPPHRSHQCHYCGCIWRPADVATTGVAAVATRGAADTFNPNRPPGDIPVSVVNGWIGVDLDGTLAVAPPTGTPNPYEIGEPIYPMLMRVRRWLAEGIEVRIFTARVDGGRAARALGVAAGEAYRDVEGITKAIQDYTEKHTGVRLAVTNEKDFAMLQIWDDRAVQVVHNHGHRIGAAGGQGVNEE